MLSVTATSTIGTDNSNGRSFCLETESAAVSQVKLEMVLPHGPIHFAYHASQDVDQPRCSILCLRIGNEKLELVDIMQQRILHYHLAYLRPTLGTKNFQRRLCKWSIMISDQAQGQRRTLVVERCYKYLTGPTLSNGGAGS